MTLISANTLQIAFSLMYNLFSPLDLSLILPLFRSGDGDPHQ